LGAGQRVQTFKNKGMQTQYEVNFLQSVFVLKVEFLLKDWIWLNLYPLNGTKGLSWSISSIWKVKDHGYRDMAWKPDIIFNFEH